VFILIFLGVSLVFLPAYSPELNPCELVFSQVKGMIKNLRGEGRHSIFDQIALSFNSVSLDNVFNYYRKCIHPKGILPELFK
jgi:transposase